MTVNGKPARATDSLRIGDLVEFELPATVNLEPVGEPIPLDVVYEDEDLVVLNKPAGMVVHPSAGHASGTLVHALLGRGGQWSAAGGAGRPGIVHRLDKGTSGLMLAARNDVAHRALSAQLADRSLSRSYLAIVKGRLGADQGVLEGPIGRHPKDRLRMAVVAGGRAARTRYAVVERRPGHTLVRCELETGRTHQIRVHLAALGHPIAGDPVYGRRRSLGDPERPMLHATALRFRHPRTGAEMVFQALPPADFQNFWESLS